MKNTPLMGSVEKINRFGPDMGGVFSYADLCNILNTGSAVANSRAIRQLVKAEILAKVQRGFYVTKILDLFILSQRLAPESYISMDSALAKAGCIGSIPKGRVSAVRPNARGKKIKTPAGDIVYHSLSREIFFGFEKQKNGVALATPEKAFLDLLYFHTKGRRFVIDPSSEIDTSQFSKPLVAQYLKKYKNLRFVKFARRLLHA